MTVWPTLVTTTLGAKMVSIITLVFVSQDLKVKTAQLTSMIARITLVSQMLLAEMVSITSPASVP